MSVVSSGNVFVAIPNLGWIRTDLAALLCNWSLRGGCSVYTPEGLRPPGYARNVCAKAFLDSNCSHILFIDDDTLPPIGAIGMLIDAKVPAISGVTKAMKRDDDGQLKAVGMVARRNGSGELKAAYGKGVERIDACGSSCILIERWVFETLEFPWYEDRAWGDIRGQDFVFCEKLEAAEVPLFANFDVQCSHRKEIDI